MKTLFKKGTAVFMILAMLLAMGATAFAAEGKTVEVKGYRGNWESLSEEEIAKLPAHFSVSNVVDTFDVKKIDESIDEGLIVEPSSKITLLVEGGVIFDVYKLTKKDETTYEFNYGEELPGSGQVEISVPDESGAVDEYGYSKYVDKTVDMSELKNYTVDFPHYLPGCSVTLTEPGDYYVIFRFEAIEGSAQAFIKVKDTNSQPTESTEPAESTETAEPTEPTETTEITEATEPTEITEITEATEPATVTAAPMASKVMVNGVEKSFDAYNINGNNYFKLRDLATVVNGSEKQFEVEWDNEKKAINLISNKAYTAVGGEMSEGDGEAKNGVLNTAKIYKDGVEVQLTAYNIDGNNYFKLRDIAKAFNIGVTWDNATKTVGIDTTTEYVEE